MPGTMRGVVPKTQDISSVMFRCEACGSTSFQLMTQPHIQAQTTIETSPEGDVIIDVAGHRRFVADLYFMNQFAVCSHCDSIGQWAYYYPSSEQSEQQAHG